ncbi:MAG: cyclic nucleotide-binding domain-containing protein [Pseudorhodoplanes sp.]|uniref:cyclic nucleotide-binding domain-containing protein n=1 Tax=Pseudorhodoplanes sp. TaxID=1934341 RepID=UPI003D12B0A2
MRIAELELIRDLPLFHDIAPENFDRLTEAALLQRFPARVELIHEGALPDFLHVVVEGSVELYAQHCGRETTLDILGPLSTFILAAVVRDEPYLKSARTLTDARILMIPAEASRDIFSRDSAFARAVVNELAMRYRSIVRALKNEKQRTGSERLANWILKADAQQGGNGYVSFEYDKRTLASLLGMTPENLSRSFSVLTQHGVRSLGRGLTIEDRDVLRSYAQPTPLIDG